MPKMTVFKGDKTWDSFIFQFERVADRCGWSSRKQAEKLVDCLGGKALEYVRELQLEEDYKRMKVSMKIHCLMKRISKNIR